ncbi:MAG: hypothetical protein AAFP19_04575, partial [Bacteroidota bacterium]
MLRKTYLLSLLALWLWSSQWGMAQDQIIKDIKAKDFFGVYEIKDFDCYAVYRDGKEVILEVFDKNLVPKRRGPIPIGIKGPTAFHSVSNGNSFCLSFFNERKKDKIFTFDPSGQMRGEMDFSEDVIDILPAEGKGYYIIIRNKRDFEVQFYNDDLKKEWGKVINDKLSMTYPNIYSRNQSGLLSMAYNYTSVGDNAIYVYKYDMKGMINSSPTGINILMRSFLGSRSTVYS